MDDDLGTPQGVAVIFDTLRRANARASTQAPKTLATLAATVNTSWLEMLRNLASRPPEHTRQLETQPAEAIEALVTGGRRPAQGLGTARLPVERSSLAGAWWWTTADAVVEAPT